MTKKNEFMVKLSIGQYLPTGSIIHRLDPRIKLLMGFIIIISSIISTSLFSLTFLWLVIFAGLMLTRVQIRSAFVPLKTIFPFLIVLSLLQIFAVPQLHSGSIILWQWGIFKITEKSLRGGILLISRFIVILSGLSLFSFTTRTTEMVHGIEHLARPLQKLGFPSHELSLVVNISIRFLPILAQETERLMKAQASRGADFGYKGHFFIGRFRRMLPLFVPLFLLSLRHAENLIEAMESRCYTGGKGRTYLVSLSAKPFDYFASIIGLVVAVSVLTMSYIHIDQVIFKWLKIHVI